MTLSWLTVVATVHICEFFLLVIYEFCYVIENFYYIIGTEVVKF
jgi:hypothetical protein